MKKVSEQLKTKAYEIGVMKLLKEVAESGEDVHQNHTPLEICDMMLDKVNLVSAKSILVLYNIELLFALRKEKYQGHVTFLTQSPKKAELAPKIFGGVVVEYIDKEENPLYLMENKWPDKFDIVIANPPYSKKLDLKFLDKAFDIAKDEIVFVHPSTAFIERKKSVTLFRDIRNKIKNNISSITLFNGNGIFGIGLYVPCSITHITKSKSNNNFILENKIDGKKQNIESEQIEDLSIFGLSKDFLSLENKINPTISIQTKSFEDRVNKKLRKPNSFFVSVPPIVGHTKQGDSKKVPMSANLYTDDFFIAVRKSTRIQSNQDSTSSLWWEFDTEFEANNFIKYCKTDFARFCISLTKMDQNIQGGGMKKVPWVDFTQEWTDEKLYVHFNITKEEQAFIKEVIPPYYD